MKIPSPLILFPVSITFFIGLVLVLKWILTGTVMISQTNGNINLVYLIAIIFAFVVGMFFPGLLMDGMNA